MELVMRVVITRSNLTKPRNDVTLTCACAMMAYRGLRVSSFPPLFIPFVKGSWLPKAWDLRIKLSTLDNRESRAKIAQIDPWEGGY